MSSTSEVERLIKQFASSGSSASIGVQVSKNLSGSEWSVRVSGVSSADVYVVPHWVRGAFMGVRFSKIGLTVVPQNGSPRPVEWITQ